MHQRVHHLSLPHTHTSTHALSLLASIRYKETLWYLMTTWFSEASYIVDAGVAAAMVMLKSQQSYEGDSASFAARV